MARCTTTMHEALQGPNNRRQRRLSLPILPEDQRELGKLYDAQRPVTQETTDIRDIDKFLQHGWSLRGEDRKHFSLSTLDLPVKVRGSGSAWFDTELLPLRKLLLRITSIGTAQSGG